MTSSVVSSNKLALISFGTVLAIFLILVDMFMISEERDFLLQTEKQHAQQELDIMGKLLTEAMIRHDYAAVEQYVPQWSQERPDVILVRVSAANGFVVAQHKQTPVSDYIYDISKPIFYLDKLVLRIEMQRDFGPIYAYVHKRIVKLIALSIVAVIVLGFSLWRVLRKTAIVPLQREIDERTKIERELESHAKELANHVEELESFSYSIAHDLRAPVRSITSFSQILVQDLGSNLQSQDKDHLQRVVAAGKYMAELIDDILTLARITRDKMNVSELQLSDMAKESVARLRELEPHRQCDVTIQPNLRAKGDFKLIRLLLDDLLGNAWKYTGKKANARVEFAMALNPDPVFYVRDNGVGFDMQYVRKLFQPFQRLHAREEFEGTGVGLASAQRIVNRHGGKIWAESELNKGATFYFTLPMP